MKKVTAKQFSEELKKKCNNINNNLTNVIKLCCEKVRSTALDDMAKTPRNENVTYGKKGHHPSLPGNAPAPDTGNLRSSVHYTVTKEDTMIIGVVGTDVEYGKMLEYGTSKVAPRPWLKPALSKNNEFINKSIKEAMNK